MHRLVAAAAERRRRYVRAVGLGHQHVERAVFDDFVVVVREGQHAGEREREAEIEKEPRFLPVASKEMHVPFHGRVSLQKRGRVLVCAALSAASDMEHERLADFICDLNVLDENFRLALDSPLVEAVVVEPALADGLDLRVARKLLVERRVELLAAAGESLTLLAELLLVVMRLRRMDGMERDCGIHAIVSFRERDSLA